jgi:hypothetical protein
MITLSDSGGAGIGAGFGGRCGDTIGLDTVGVGVASCHELGDVHHEGKRSRRRRLGRTGRKRRREEMRHIWRKTATLGL